MSEQRVTPANEEKGSRRKRYVLALPVIGCILAALTMALVSGDAHAYLQGNRHPDTVSNISGPAPARGNVVTPTSTPACGLMWRNFGDIMPSTIDGVALLALDNIWAVGSGGIGHWDGTQWTFGMGTGGQLYDISALSPNDIWAVGNTPGGLTLAEHWDGTQWTVVPSPNPSPNFNTLEGVAAISHNNVWAVGDDTGVLHWDGVSWTQVPSPSRFVYYRDIEAISPDDIWAVGNDGSLPSTTIALHWDGSVWTRVPSPNSSVNENVLQGVSAVASDDVWAVGYQCCSSPSSYTTLIEHWDGTQWSILPSPNPGTSDNRLNAVAAISSQEVWAVGDAYATSDMNSALIERWNGQSWSVEPNTFSNVGTLYCVEALSPSDIWALGNRVVRYYDPCITPSPTPPTGALLVGHVTWQGPPSQPNARQQLPVTLTLQSGSAYIDYPSQDTNARGFFTAGVGTLPSGTYQWRVKGPRYLANCGTVTLTGAPATHAEMSLMRTGDANNSNAVNTTDFTILKSGFGGTSDLRADFTNDGVVNTNDFALLKGNFGSVGCSP